MNSVATLREQDQLLTEIAGLVYRCAPTTPWKGITLHAKYTPDGSVGSHEFDVELADGRVDRTHFPPMELYRQTSTLTERHWSLSQPRWFAMHLRVTRDGRVHADWEYTDDYQIGDIMRRG